MELITSFTVQKMMINTNSFWFCWIRVLTFLVFIGAVWTIALTYAYFKLLLSCRLSKEMSFRNCKSRFILVL